VTCGGAFVVVVFVLVVPFGVVVVVFVVVVPFGVVVVVFVVEVPFGAFVVVLVVIVPLGAVVFVVVAVFVVVGVGVGVGVVVRVGAGTLRARTFVVILVEHVSRVPPLLPVPLHWLTRTGTAALTLDVGDTEQTAAEPPPVTEPLH
jgi:hypothetical protein